MHDALDTAVSSRGSGRRTSGRSLACIISTCFCHLSSIPCYPPNISPHQRSLALVLPSGCSLLSVISRDVMIPAYISLSYSFLPIRIMLSVSLLFMQSSGSFQSMTEVFASI